MGVRGERGGRSDSSSPLSNKYSRSNITGSKSSLSADVTSVVDVSGFCGVQVYLEALDYLISLHCIKSLAFIRLKRDSCEYGYKI